MLPEGFVQATGYGPALVTRELPLALGPVHVDMVWHLRHDGTPSHRWLRQQVQAAADQRAFLPETVPEDALRRQAASASSPPPQSRTVAGSGTAVSVKSKL